MMRKMSRPSRTVSGSCLAILVITLGGAPACAQESWDAVYLGGSKTGFVHTWVEKVNDKGRDYNRVRIEIEQRLKRGEDEAVIKLHYGTIETLDGEVLKLDTRTQAGGTQDIRVFGEVRDQKMHLTMEGSGQAESQVIPWDPDVRGPYGAEQSMARQPMKEHEKRPIKMYIPELNKVSDITLEARVIEPVLLGDGTKHPLLRVDQITRVDGKRQPQYDARLYVDPEGQILKSEQDVLGGMAMYRTTKEAAMTPAGPVRFDLIRDSVIKVPRKIPNAEESNHIKYRVTLKDSDPADVFPVDARQSVSPDGASKSSAIIEIKSAGPLDGIAVTEEIDAQYLRPNALVTSDDVRVRSLAQRVTRGRVDPWQKATVINKWVFQNIQGKHFKVAFAAAAEVARKLEGDCTEHSVLAAAMCRAVGVPSRVVVGLIYVEQNEGFGFHMWNEVFVNNRWVALDPSFGQTDVDAVHIKLSDSSLEGVAPFQAFLPVVTVVGKLSIEPIEIR
jgi:hypothetical protein